MLCFYNLQFIELSPKVHNPRRRYPPSNTAATYSALLSFAVSVTTCLADVDQVLIMQSVWSIAQWWRQCVMGVGVGGICSGNFFTPLDQSPSATATLSEGPVCARLFVYGRSRISSGHWSQACKLMRVFSSLLISMPVFLCITRAHHTYRPCLIILPRETAREREREKEN